MFTDFCCTIFQMGLSDPTDMSSMNAMVYGDLENDEELEAELAALQGDAATPVERSPKKGELAYFPLNLHLFL